MNLERADPSYTAWDNAIVAKSKGREPLTPGNSAGTSSRNQETRANNEVHHSVKAFDSALTHANAHEHDIDPSQRGQDNESFGFWDFIDIINPLQHIPVVSTIYRDLTGDTISAPARIAGGMLYGGPLGFASSIGNAIVEETAGQDVGEIAMAMVFEEETLPESGGTVVASAAASPAGPARAQAGIAEEQPPVTVAAQSSEGNLPRENAGSAAVSQMQANNAALQALLNDMGLASGAVSNPGSPTNKTPQSTTPGALASAQSDGGAQLASAAAIASPPARVTSNTTPSAVNPLAQDQTEPPAERKSIPIDPSRYINTRASTPPSSGAAAATNAVAGKAANISADELKTVTNETAASSDSTGGVERGESDRAAIQASFADRMLEGLERYQSMTQERGALPGLDAGKTPGAI